MGLEYTATLASPLSTPTLDALPDCLLGSGNWDLGDDISPSSIALRRKNRKPGGWNADVEIQLDHNSVQVIFHGATRVERKQVLDALTATLATHGTKADFKET